MSKSSIVLLAFILILSSCGNKTNTPPGILKKDSMQAVLWDVIKADAFTTEFTTKDTLKNAVEENVKLQQAIFAMHHTSREEFYNSFNYYKSNTVQMRTMLDSMLSKANRDKFSNNNINIKFNPKPGVITEK